MLLVAVGLPFIIAGIVVATSAGRVVSRANTGRRIPIWRDDIAYRRPPSYFVRIVVAAVLVGIGGLFCIKEWGPVTLFVLMTVHIPPLVVSLIHNRELARNAPLREQKVAESGADRSGEADVPR